MPKFDDTLFSDVEYDLRRIRSVHTGEFIDDHGVVPEPSRQLVAETMKRVSAAFKKMDIKGGTDLGENPSPDEVSAAMSSLDQNDLDRFAEMSDELVEIIGDLCQGHPKKESVDALSYPKLMAFFGYVMDNLLSPEASTPGTTVTQRRVSSV